MDSHFSQVESQDTQAYQATISLGVEGAPYTGRKTQVLCYNASGFWLRLAFPFTSTKTCILSIHFRMHSDLAIEL